MVFSRGTAVISSAVFSADSWSIYRLDIEKSSSVKDTMGWLVVATQQRQENAGGLSPVSCECLVSWVVWSEQKSKLYQYSKIVRFRRFKCRCREISESSINCMWIAILTWECTDCFFSCLKWAKMNHKKIWHMLFALSCLSLFHSRHLFEPLRFVSGEKAFVLYGVFWSVRLENFNTWFSFKRKLLYALFEKGLVE